VRSDNRLAIAIFAALVAIIVLPLAYQGIRQKLRPRLVEARVVTATDHDPVFRNGPRQVPPGHEVTVAIAIRIERFGRRSRWLAPATTLELDGTRVDHVEANAWPERDRSLRVFWFTVECINVGGDMSADDAAKRMRYRAFLAPEMGRELLAVTYPESHNDDHLGLPEDTAPVDAGTLRFYARLESFDPSRELRPQQALTTMPTDRYREPSFPAVHRATTCPGSVRPEIGELFLLPGFEPISDPPDAWNEVTREALGVSFTELVERRLAVSSRTFAAVAVNGSPVFEAEALRPSIQLRSKGGAFTSRGRPLRWQQQILAGDLLRDGTHWTVLLSDDGNGELDAADAVIHCWRSPPAKTTLGAVIKEEVEELELLRRTR
jgi:hypothetical protein